MTAHTSPRSIWPVYDSCRLLTGICETYESISGFSRSVSPFHTPSNAWYVVQLYSIAGIGILCLNNDYAERTVDGELKNKHRNYCTPQTLYGTRFLVRRFFPRPLLLFFSVGAFCRAVSVICPVSFLCTHVSVLVGFFQPPCFRCTFWWLNRPDKTNHKLKKQQKAKVNLNTIMCQQWWSLPH